MTPKLLIDEYPLIILPNLATAIGLNEAIMLQQIHYWVETFKKTKNEYHFQDGEWWVWNTGAEWQENFPFWSERTVWRVIDSLRTEYISFGKHVTRAPLIITGNYNKKGYDKTLWYRIDYAELERIEKAYCQVVKMALTECQDGIDNVSTPIPETTPETTPEKNQDASVDAIPSEHTEQDAILDFYDGVVPERNQESTPTKIEKRDAVDDIVQQAGRRESVIPWLLPGTYCGDHDYKIPLEAFCAVIRRSLDNLGSTRARQWMAELENIAIKENIGTPALLAIAIKAIRDDWNFTNDRWRTPFNKAFGEQVGLAADRIATGEFVPDGKQQKGWSTSL